MIEDYHASSRFPIATYLGMTEGGTAIALSWFCTAQCPGRRAAGSQAGVPHTARTGSRLLEARCSDCCFFLGVGPHWFCRGDRLVPDGT
ncbi:hypothetical protein NDU88_011594 [Pleurodeles waltl]|uniref:Uncharacterized protein n=1 Tax=Pleurodeles waltl TaxID=8319 RepID=A0AAV7S2R0_PLEWA|nr:hypothetical protein NDU88_011594 [Pleurodeles waltl]